MQVRYVYDVTLHPLKRLCMTAVRSDQVTGVFKGSSNSIRGAHLRRSSTKGKSDIPDAFEPL